MPVDFSEENVPKRKLESCRIHNLKYDPGTTWGCVLCKKGQTKRISWMLVVGGILVVAALAFLLVPKFMNKEPAYQAPVIHVAAHPVSAADSEAAAAPDTCLSDRSNAVEKCLAALTGESATQIDRELCLNPLNGVETECSGVWTIETAKAGPLYSFGTMPAWASVLAPFEQNQKIVEDCVHSAQYKFGLRVTINSQTGAVSELVATTFGLDAGSRQCIYSGLSKLAFPMDASQQSYSFMTLMDSAVLQLNRPQEVDEAKLAYEKFVQDQRKEAVDADRRAEIKAQAEERGARYRDSLDEKKP